MTAAAAGWYTDPADNTALRWWDGAQWTAVVQARPHAAPAISVATQERVPGWYADPADASSVRWWDGGRWTEHVQTAIVDAPSLPPGGASVHPAMTPVSPTFTSRNGFSLLVALLCLVWFLLFYAEGVLVMSLWPLIATHWARKRQEPLAFSATCLAVLVLLLSIYFWTT